MNAASLASLPSPDPAFTREAARQTLEDQLIEFAAHMNAAEYRLICLLDEFDQTDGCLSVSNTATASARLLIG